MTPVRLAEIDEHTSVVWPPPLEMFEELISACRALIRERDVLQAEHQMLKQAEERSRHFYFDMQAECKRLVAENDKLKHVLLWYMDAGDLPRMQDCGDRAKQVLGV